MITEKEHLNNISFPPEWEIVKLGEIGNFTKGGSVSKKMLSSKGFPCVLYGEIYTKYHFLARELSSRIPKEDINYAKQINYGDILFAGSGETAEEIGKCFAYIGNTSAFAGGDLIIFTPSKGNSVFLAYLLNSPPINKQKEKLGQGHSVVHIYIKHLESINIPLPPLSEQDAIAEVLSDVDALIEAQEVLIEKKRLIKQGVMQELLTGKRRLPGFSGEWMKIYLSKILDYEQPGEYVIRIEKPMSTGSMPVLTPGKTFVLGYTNEKSGVYRNLPVILFDDFTTASRYVDFPFKVDSSAVKMLTCKTENFNLHFVFEKMQLIKFPIGNHKRYYISEYQNMEVTMPEIEEQNAISSVLLDMDREITTLERGLEKYKLIKNGMMQELLTGQTRLV